MGKRVYRLIVIGVVWAIATQALAAESSQSIPIEYQVKAAFLYKFIKFVEWPREVLTDTSNTVVIGVLGNSPVFTALEQASERDTSYHRLAVKHFNSIKDLEFCHILFISQGHQHGLREVLNRLRTSGTLTVGEDDNFAEIGGMVNFVIIENKVRFEINVEASKRGGLRISSKLLRLARIVRERT